MPTPSVTPDPSVILVTGEPEVNQLEQQFPKFAKSISDTYDRAYRQGIEHSIRIVKLFVGRENGIENAIIKLDEILLKDA